MQAGKKNLERSQIWVRREGMEGKFQEERGERAFYGTKGKGLEGEGDAGEFESAMGR